MAKSLSKDFQAGKSCLEVGSLNVNGSIREVCDGFAEYIGLDMRPGLCVDVVSKAEDYEPGRQFDVVISGGTLEHCEDWKGVVEKMQDLVKEGGLVVLHSHTVGTGYHPHPEDHWRFNAEIFEKAFDGFEIEEVVEEGGDVYITAKKPGGWVSKPIEVEALARGGVWG